MKLVSMRIVSTICYLLISLKSRPVTLRYAPNGRKEIRFYLRPAAIEWLLGRYFRGLVRQLVRHPTSCIRLVK